MCQCQTAQILQQKIFWYQMRPWLKIGALQGFLQAEIWNFDAKWSQREKAQPLVLVQCRETSCCELAMCLKPGKVGDLHDPGNRR